MSSLSREQILGTPLPSEVVDVPEWDGKIILRGLSARDRDEYEQSLLEVGRDGTTRVKRHHDNVRASLVVRCIVDDNGERLFTDEEVSEVGKLDGAVVNRLWQKARELSGMGEEAEETGRRGFRHRPGRRQLYRVALALGVTPNDLQDRLSGRDLTEWAAFEQVYGPILVHERIDVAQAMICTILANSSGSKRRYELKDFLPRWDQAPRTDEVVGKMEQLFGLAKGGDPSQTSSRSSSPSRRTPRD